VRQSSCSSFVAVTWIHGMTVATPLSTWLPSMDTWKWWRCVESGASVLICSLFLSTYLAYGIKYWSIIS
jgi:hypothetical protein